MITPWVRLRDSTRAPLNSMRYSKVSARRSVDAHSGFVQPWWWLNNSTMTVSRSARSSDGVRRPVWAIGASMNASAARKAAAGTARRASGNDSIRAPARSPKPTVIVVIHPR